MRGQISFFDGSRPFEIDKPVRLIELFAGIGAQAKALERLGLDFEPYKIAEWDIYANCSYRAVHCPTDTRDYSEGLSLEEVTEALVAACLSGNGKDPLTPAQIAARPEKWRRGVYSNLKATHNIGSIVAAAAADLAITATDKYTYLVTYSFPCQDLSLAGKRRGMEKGAGTHSGLLWEFERILKECPERPQVLLMENVPAVCQSKNDPAFAEWLNTLESLGYRNYYKTQNALDCGIPQNRERCIMISLLGDYYYDFPEPRPLERCVLDYLEEKVPEKYYLSPNDLEITLTSNFNSRSDISGGGVYKNPIEQGLQRRGSDCFPFCICAGRLSGGKYEKWIDIARRVYSADGVCPTLHTVPGGGMETKIIVRENTLAGFSTVERGGN